MMSFVHEKWMRHAMGLAEKGQGRVSPNPLVGACLVREGRLVAQGYHRYYGGDHAEVVALRKAGGRARGSILYVTLEPCSTWGKTPPCVQAILRSGIAHVVIGMKDPNPRHHGRGIALLKKAGVQVTTGILCRDIERQNEAFCKFIRRKKPFVILKMAQSLDGKIATCAGHSRWITSPRSRAWVHRLRQEADGILVGQNTVLLDNPSLSVRGLKRRGPSDKPWRIFFDPGLKVPAHFKIFRGRQISVRVVAPRDAVLLRRKGIGAQRHAGEILLTVSQRRGKFDCHELLSQLAALGISKLLIEGGGETAWSFLNAGSVDRLFWLVAPKIIGGRDAKTSVEGDGFERLERTLAVKHLTCLPVGKDWLFQGDL